MADEQRLTDTAFDRWYYPDAYRNVPFDHREVLTKLRCECDASHTALARFAFEAGRDSILRDLGHIKTLLADSRDTVERAETSTRQTIHPDTIDAKKKAS